MDTYKLTPKAKQCLSIAKKEAQLLRNRYAGTEHLLLGLLNIGDSIITEILEDFSIDIDDLRNIVYDNISQEGDDPVSLDEIDFTPRVEKVIEVAHNCAVKLDKDKIDIDHMFLGLLYESDGVANSILKNLGVSYNKVKSEIESELGGDIKSTLDEDDSFIEYDETIRNLKHLQKYGTDITRLAARKKIDPIIGRSSEITRLTHVLCRKTKNNPILIGEAGVGKTAVVEGLAQRIVEGKVPEILFNKHIISLDLGLLVAGTKYRGQFEERLKNIIGEIKKNKNIIVFIDEIHMMAGAGSAEGAMDAANILKPALARGELRCIGATTNNEYRKHIESDSALDRRFQPIKVKEPTLQDSIEILNGIKSSYEKFHNVKYTDESLQAAVKLSVRYITDRNLPDKAIDLIDEAGAMTHVADENIEQVRQFKEQLKTYRQKKESLVVGQQFEEAGKYRDKEKECESKLTSLINARKKNKRQKISIDEDKIRDIVSSITGIPIAKTDKTEIDRALELSDTLNSIVIGQEEAVTCISNALKRFAAKLPDPDRPIASFLFLGPTGVGKTYLAKQVAEYMFDEGDSFIQVDMSELMDQHSSAKLIGSPPGYIGHQQGGKLTEKIRRNPYSLVLFDEVEKADPDVLNILLQILEEGHLTDGIGRTVNFKNTIIAMTTNVGAEKISDKSKIGFVQLEGKEKNDQAKNDAVKEVKKQFRPEFINRIDEIVTFNSLTEDQSHTIVELIFDEYVQRIKEEHDVILELDKSAVKYFAAEGFDEEYGARELRRTMKRLFETSFSELILAGSPLLSKPVICYVKAKKVKFKNKKD